jgi:hypothetical protein
MGKIKRHVYTNKLRYESTFKPTFDDIESIYAATIFPHKWAEVGDPRAPLY